MAADRLLYRGRNGIDAVLRAAIRADDNDSVGSGGHVRDFLETALSRECRIDADQSGIVNRARKTCVVLSAVRLLDHINDFPSGEKTGRPSNPSVNVIRVLR